MKILIVDDEEAILKMYSIGLAEFEIISASSGEEALEKARKEQPDLIYLDIIMPKINGLDVLKRLKSDKETAHIPVILLTNLPEEASAAKAKSLGANDYFVKVDFEPDKLAEKTREIINEISGKN
jgi:DNA-binding response OmpR family regulator